MKTSVIASRVDTGLFKEHGVWPVWLDSNILKRNVKRHLFVYSEHSNKSSEITSLKKEVASPFGSYFRRYPWDAKYSVATEGF